MEERREYPRVEILNFIYYVIHASGEVITKDIGRALDASEKGLLIETHIPMVVDLNLKLDISVENAILELSGKVVHTHSDTEGMFHSGVELDSMESTTRQQFMAYLERFESAEHGQVSS